MKNITLFLFIVFISFASSAQDITGKWNGILSVQGTQLRLVFNISKTDSGYAATMDSPDQGAKGIPVTSTTFSNSVLKIEVSNARIEYEGTIDKDNNITGNFKQAGQSFPMNLSREEKAIVKPARPQEPSKPYPYYSEDITFENKKDGVILAGTLTLPKQEGNYPVVILISGSGPQNRDEELLGHKPFLVLSDHLTKNGIAVLRYDDRGVASSKGNFKTSTSADFASDVESAVDYLKTRKEINKNKIGLIGHSEGGIIAPMVAAKSKDISFIVLLAGTGIPGDELLLLQAGLIERVSGEKEEDIKKGLDVNRGAFDIVKKSKDTETLKNDLTNYLKKLSSDSSASDKPPGMTEEEFINLQVNQLASPWMQYFIKYNPATSLEKVKCPVLAINGEKDLQVPPKENLSAIKKALEKAGNKNVTAKELPGLNHLFQECKTGSPDEYSQIEQTFSPTALTEISKWILLQLK